MVYVLLAPGFEESEAIVPTDLLRQGGLETALVSLSGPTVTGGHNITVQADLELSQVDLDQAEMIVLPGGGVGVGFEGGQMPLARRIPKRGFNNIFAKPLEIINLSALNAFEDGETVTAEALLEKGILSKCEYGFKVLGNGKVSKKVTVKASAFSASAKEAIEAAGGKAEVM